MEDTDPKAALKPVVSLCISRAEAAYARARAEAEGEGAGRFGAADGPRAGDARHRRQAQADAARREGALWYEAADIARQGHFPKVVGPRSLGLDLGPAFAELETAFGRRKLVKYIKP